MKFGKLLEYNSNVDWWDKYVDYDALKKRFPNVPLDPTYLATQNDLESSQLLGSNGQEFDSPEVFRQALDRELNKVVTFYNDKLEQVEKTWSDLEDEVREMEDRELIDVIEEEEENEEEDNVAGEMSDERDTFLRNASRNRRSRSSVIGRFLPRFRRRASPGRHEADLLEAAYPGPLRRSRSSSNSKAGMSSPRRLKTPMREIDDPMDRALVPGPRHTRRSSEAESSDDGNVAGDRRLSVSSASSGRDYSSRGRYHSLGLVMMDPSTVPAWVDQEEDRQVLVWTADSNYGRVVRIGFKKRIAQVWLEAYALKQYIELNNTAFEKILKKYDKNTNSKLKKQYMAETVATSTPWLPESREHLDHFLARILFHYRRVAVAGDEDLAKEQLRAQLREKVVVDRETVWSQMVSQEGGRASEGKFRSIEPEMHITIFDEDPRTIKTPFGKFRPPTWLSLKGCIVIFALGVMAAIVVIQPFERVEVSNCMAMLVFCTILWATEAIPLFVTSLAVPLLVVGLRVMRSADGKDTRMSASDATKYVFSQMFSPTIMLLIGGFTIAAVLSKTRLDVMTASRVLNAAGSRPSVVLLVLMFVATFASMWISNVAAPTLCYALIRPITDELHPKSIFSRCLIIAIALASNIGGQASPISSPQNLIALQAMETPLSWIQWFAISIPTSGLSVIVIWAMLHLGYRWESDLRIPKMRKNTDSLTAQHYYVLLITVLTIGLWCAEKSLEDWVGDMGVIAIIPLLAFFGTGILSKDDFHSFHWSIVFLAMGGIALGKAVLSSGLLDALDSVLESFVEGMGLYKILMIFSAIALVIATFISHTIAAVLLVPIATRIGDGMDDPHPRLLIMVTALICSAGMGLPVSGFPNMTAITQENKLGNRFIEASDFLKNGIPASMLATLVIGTVGYGIMRTLGL